MLLITTFWDPSPIAELLPGPLAQRLWTEPCNVHLAYSTRCGLVKSLPSQIKLSPAVASAPSQLGRHPTAPLSQARTPDSCTTSSVGTIQRERNWPSVQGGKDCAGALPQLCPSSLSHLLTHCARNLLSGSATGTTDLMDQ